MNEKPERNDAAHFFLLLLAFPRGAGTHSSISELDLTKKNHGVGFNNPFFSDEKLPSPSSNVSLNDGVDDDAELLVPSPAPPPLLLRGRWIRMAFRLAKSSGSGVSLGLRWKTKRGKAGLSEKREGQAGEGEGKGRSSPKLNLMIRQTDPYSLVIAEVCSLV